MIHILIGIFGGMSSLIMLPSIVRIIKRKSSNDFSTLTAYLGLLAQFMWLFYGMYIENNTLVFSSVCWCLILLFQLVLILKYKSE